MGLYRGFGLVIAADFSIPGTIPLSPRDHAEPQLSIDWQKAIAAPESPHPLYVYADGQLVFAPPSVARFTCTIDRVEIAPLASADPDEVTALLIATVLPALCWWRGLYMLHAAGVIMPGSDGALAIVGQSGSGKSTIAAQLVAQGASLLGDDSLAIDTGCGMASGLPAGIHLHSPGEPERAFHQVADLQTRDSAPLNCIVILADKLGDELLTRLEPLAAMSQLLAHQHRPRVPAILGLRGEAIAMAGSIARSVPVLLWQRSKLSAPVTAERLAELAMWATDR